MACGILLPQSGIKRELSVEAAVLTTELPWKYQNIYIIIYINNIILKEYNNFKGISKNNRLLDSSHPAWCVMVPHCGFDLHFSDNEWC